MALSSARGKLIGVIGDEVGISGLYWLVFTIHLQNHSFQDTCVGFLLGGIGELDKNRLVLKTSCWFLNYLKSYKKYQIYHRRPNFMVVDKNTAISDIEVRNKPCCWRIRWGVTTHSNVSVSGHSQELHSPGWHWHHPDQSECGRDGEPSSWWSDIAFKNHE